MLHLIGTYLPRALRYIVWDPLWRMPERDQVLYLTFDDGPDPDATPQLLEIFEKHQAHATFFLRGDHAEQHPQIVRALTAAGHTIGNHTYSHVNAWKVHHGEYAEELSRATEILNGLAGAPVRWMRPPFGKFTPRTLIWCKHAGQKLVMWDVLPCDFVAGITADQIARRTQRFMRAGSIVCLHDNHKSRQVTPAAMRELLPRLIDSGWTCAALPAEQPVPKESVPLLRSE